MLATSADFCAAVSTFRLANSRRAWSVRCLKTNDDDDDDEEEDEEEEEEDDDSSWPTTAP
jgi:hypothetical protein